MRKLLYAFLASIALAIPLVAIGQSPSSPNFWKVTGNARLSPLQAYWSIQLPTMSADPSGVNGMMLFNSNTGTFRCFEGTWKNCIGGAASTTGITTLNGQTGATQSYATNTTATGLNLSVISATNVHTFALSLTSGYNIPLTASTTNWNTAFGWGNHATAGYLTSATAASTYVPLAYGSSTFATYSYASSTFPGFTYATSTFATYSYASSTFPRFAYASSTFPGFSYTSSTFETTLTKGNLTATSPLQFDNTRQVIGGAAAISVAYGYAIPTTASSTGWDTAHSLRHAAVTLAGENYLSISGQQITAGAITLSGSNVTGVLPIANGGTGTSTAVAASQLLVGNGTSYDSTTLPSCSNSTTSKLLYNSTTRTFSCGTDQSGSGGGATTTITSNIQIDGPNFTFATGTMTGLNLNITGSGSTVTFSPVLQAGYNIPLTASTTNWNTAYGWGNHASAGYLTSATAASTYVPFTYASSTFPSFGYATSTFPSFSYASSTFPSFSYATTTFPNFSYASSTFPSFTYATSTFVTYGYATNTFATIANYPTYTYASSSYFTLFNTVAGSNIVITTSTALKTIAVSSTPTFTSVSTTNASTSHLTIAGSLYDSYSSRGALGEVLQSTATSTKWVATSTLGISGSLSGGTNGYAARWTSGSTLAASKWIDNGTVVGFTATSTNHDVTIRQSDSSHDPFQIIDVTGVGLMVFTGAGAPNGGLGVSMGLGTSTPAARLHVVGSAGNYPPFQVSSSTGTSILQITASAEVIIGASAKLRIPIASSPSLTTGGQIAINTRDASSTSISLHDGTLQKYITDEFLLGYLDIEYSSSTNLSNNESLPLPTVPATTTITRIICYNYGATNDRMPFNLVWDNSPFTATSSATSKAFSTIQNCTGTSTPQTFQPSGSTTINSLQALRLITGIASSTKFHITVYGRRNQ